MTQQAIENSAMTTLTKICGEETTVLNPAITCLSTSAYSLCLPSALIASLLLIFYFLSDTNCCQHFANF